MVMSDEAREGEGGKAGKNNGNITGEEDPLYSVRPRVQIIDKVENRAILPVSKSFALAGETGQLICSLHTYLPSSVGRSVGPACPSYAAHNFTVKEAIIQSAQVEEGRVMSESAPFGGTTHYSIEASKEGRKFLGSTTS